MRERWRLLSLFLFGRARLRPNRSCRRLRARMPADRGGFVVRDPAAATEDTPNTYNSALMLEPVVNPPREDSMGRRLAEQFNG